MKISSQEGNVFSPWVRAKFEKKSPFLPENIFSAPTWFSSETKNSYVQLFKKFICSIVRDVSFQKQLQQCTPGELVLLKFCQNVPTVQPSPKSKVVLSIAIILLTNCE